MKITVGKWKMRNGEIANITTVEGGPLSVTGNINGGTERWYYDGRYYKNEESEFDLICPIDEHIPDQEEGKPEVRFRTTIPILGAEGLPSGKNEESEEIQVLSFTDEERAAREAKALQQLNMVRIRDIALKAMVALIGTRIINETEATANIAYDMADAMIAEESKRYDQ